MATASSVHGEEREAKQFWPNTPQSSPLIYQTLPQHQYPIHYPVGFGFGGVTRGVKLRTKVTGTLKGKTVTPAIQKFRFHQQKNRPATDKDFEQAFWLLDKVSFRSDQIVVGSILIFFGYFPILMKFLQNGDDELSRNEFMGLSLLSEEYVDPADLLTFMGFFDQNNDKHIQRWEYNEMVDYVQDVQDRLENNSNDYFTVQ